MNLPSPQDAENNLFRGVRDRIFFDVMAQRGHVPYTEKQAQAMLETAGMIAEQLHLVKEAAADPYEQAGQLLSQRLHGGTKTASERDVDHLSQQFAASLMQDPTVYNSVLSIQAARADDWAARYNVSP